MRIRAIAVISATVLLSACSQVIPKDVLQAVNRNIAFGTLMKDPMMVKGQTVLLGGVIVKSTNEPDGTLIEMYQTELDWEMRPVNVDASGGRFLATYPGFLDNQIYSEGRKATLAGVVIGVRTMKLGEMEYRYPWLLVRSIHLWQKEKPEVYAPYPWYPWGPWGMWGPFYYPYRWY